MSSAWRDRIEGWPRNPTLWVAVVAVFYLVLQLVVLDPARFFEWDEAVYVSEVSRFAEPIGLAAHRARGVTLIVAPVVQVTQSIVVMRSYLVLVSSVALYLSFALWCRIVGWAAPIAAALFATSWLTVFYGSEVSPNLYSAFLAVAATAVAFRAAEHGSQRDHGLLLFLVAGAALMRPVDGLVLLVSAPMIALVIARQRMLTLAATAAAGFALGMVPWIVEAVIEFGGPLARLEEARRLVGGGVTGNWTEYLRLLDGPLIGPDRSLNVTNRALAWLGVLVAAGLFGATVGESRRRRAAILSLGVSALLALPYLAGADAAAPRFLLPAFGLLCIGAGAGIRATVEAARARPTVIAVVATALVALVSWNVTALRSIAEQQTEQRADAFAVGQALASAMPTGDCFFLSQFGYPQISLASGCEGDRLSEDPLLDEEKLARAASEGKSLALLSLYPRETDLSESGWHCGPIKVPGGDWQICTL